MLNNLKDYQCLVLGHKGNGYTENRKIGPGEFVGINPRKSPNGTTNQDIVKITCIILDIDPLDNKANPIELAKKIALLENYKSYVIVSSGRGAHVYVPVDLPTNTAVKEYLAFLHSIYGDEHHKIDSIGDLARVIRVWGSINEKNGKICEIVEDHYTGINTFKLPTYKNQDIQKISPIVGDIITGNRNSTLTKLAGSMRNKGFTPESIEVALIKENQARCVPPLSEQEVRSIAKSVSRYEPKPVPIVKGTIGLQTHSQEYLKNLETRKPGYSTGFTKLDDMLVGLQKGRMYVLVARTNEGKTSFACNIAHNLIKQGVSVLYFPTELGYAPLFDKIVAQAADIPLKIFQHGIFNDEQTKKIKKTVEDLSKYPFTVHEDFSLTLETIKQHVQESAPQAIIVDFIGAMKYVEGGTPQEIAANVRGLKELAEENQIPLILCAQFNRGQINNEISMQYIKGSGSIEEFADVVMALQTVNYNVYPRVVDLHILKNRYSEIGRIRLNFYSALGKFEERPLDI